MKIPTTSAGNGYYGYESILQHAIDDLNGGQQTPPAPQLPPAQVPVTGIAATPSNDFSEYMWMENEEEFDKQVWQELEEEALMQECMEAMLEDENAAAGQQTQPPATGNNWNNSSSTDDNSLQIQLSQCLEGLKVQDVASQSSLNPNAAEFVPRSFRASTTTATSS